MRDVRQMRQRLSFCIEHSATFIALFEFMVLLIILLGVACANKYPNTSIAQVEVVDSKHVVNSNGNDKYYIEVMYDGIVYCVDDRQAYEYYHDKIGDSIDVYLIDRGTRKEVSFREE